MEALAARGHAVRVVARVEHFGAEAHAALVRELTARGAAPRHERASVEFQLNGVEVGVLTRDPNLRTYFAAQLRAFAPDIILASTDDPAHLMLEIALRSPRARVVYLVRATVALPFGPDTGLPSEFQTEALRQADGAVAVSETSRNTRGNGAGWRPSPCRFRCWIPGGPRTWAGSTTASSAW